MRVQLLSALAVMAVVSGCDDSQPTQPSQPIVVRSQAQDQLHQLSDMNRAIALRRAIYDSGSSCQRVTESGYVQEYGNLSMWTASCADRKRFAIFVAPDATVQVRRCDGIVELGLPECVIRQGASPAGEDASVSANEVTSENEGAEAPAAL